MDSIADLPANPQAHAADPTPPPSSNGAHPPYSEMIVAAIGALHDKDGSSRQAIAKYIEKEYPNLPPTHSTLLTHHLKRMKNEGELMMLKHSYILPPPRSVPFQLPHSSDTFANNPENSALQPRRKPGRPPKPRQDFGDNLQSNYAEPIFASLGLDDDGVAPNPPSETAVVSAKRGRGRPPKGKGGGRSVVTTSVSGNSGSDVEVGQSSVERRKPGRPKLMSMSMVNGGVAKRSVGRPRRIGGPVSVPLSGYAMRPRGRPKRSMSQNVSVNNGDDDGGSVSRGRGRPPKNKFRKLTSQQFGWSNKVESGTAVLVTDPHQLVAFQELKCKYEHLQSKAKEVLNVVRPYANSDYAVFGAVQELETLVADV